MALKFTTNACINCGETSVVELTEAEALALQGNTAIQNALPERSADFRELLISGIHSECWDKMFL